MKIKLFIISISIFILTILFNFSIHAATWEFRWTNTVVHVPLGGNLSEYSLQPEARLYRDGALLADANISYLREGDWLYFMSNVNTTRVGTYKVWYKASEKDKYRPGTCTGYKALISFVVEDLVKPKVDIISDNVFIQRESITPTTTRYEELTNQIKANVNASDNYSECEIVLSHNIDFTKTGTYDVTASAIDSSGNRDSKSFKVSIYDSSYPVITFSGTGDNFLKIPLGSNANIRDYFTATDEIDGDISSLIEYPMVKVDEICEYNYTVSVKNKSGNTTTKTIRIYVVDDTPPTMKLQTHNLLLDYKTNFDEYDFASKVSLTDNLPINYDNLSITTDVKNEVGSYTVWYSYTDGVYEVEDTIDLKCISKEKPKIMADDIVIKAKSNADLKNYITVYDDSDNNIYESLEIDDSKVNYLKKGTYYATVCATNSSGQSATQRIKVIISGSVLEESNIAVIIILIVFLIITIGYGGFFVYYFVIRKRKKSN